MKILIDADSCPVTALASDIAYYNQIPCTVVYDTAHILPPMHADHIMVDKGQDSADIRIMNLVQRGDIVITHDRKLAQVCVSKGAYVLDHNGCRLDSFVTAKKRSKQAKRTEKQNLDFESELSDLIWEIQTREDEAENQYAYSD